MNTMKREKLVTARYSKGWSQEKLAEEVGVQRTAVSNWERGITDPYPIHVHRLCQLFAMSAEELGLVVGGKRMAAKRVRSVEGAVVARSEAADGIMKEVRLEATLSQVMASTLEGAALSSLPANQSEALSAFSQAIRQDIIEVKQGTFFLPETEALVPVSDTILTLPIAAASAHHALWFILKQQQWEALVGRYHGHIQRCGELYVRLNQEFEMTKSPLHDPDSTISRRQAIGAIAVLPLSLLTQMEGGKAQVLAEEFLPRCVASLAACKRLVYDHGDYGIVEYTLSRSEVILLGLVQQSARYRSAAAELLSPLYLLMGDVAWYRHHKLAEIASIQQAVQYAGLAGKDTLFVNALQRLADAHHVRPIQADRALRPLAMLDALQKAQPVIEHVSPKIRSAVYITSATANAQLGKTQEALRFLELAGEVFPFAPTVDQEIALESSLNIPYLNLLKGIAYLELGEHDPAYYQNAEDTFAQVEAFPATIASSTSTSTRIGIANCRAFAALKARNLERFKDCFTAGIQGAQSLGSEKLRKEAVAIYQKASYEVWPYESRVKDLAELFVQ
jgi:transcriptional regulator with XRE-family HTH domain